MTQTKLKPKRVKALYNCVADNPDELTFSEGDVIIVDGEEDQEWWVSLGRGGGVFPQVRLPCPALSSLSCPFCFSPLLRGPPSGGRAMWAAVSRAHLRVCKEDVALGVSGCCLLHSARTD